ncbi:MAG: hypothetical protein GY769_10285 [bacterium]|nr:hypothetical protein [bacterium]
MLAEDTELGGVRNHAPESMPLAEAVRAYVEGLDEIDFGECPPDFATAFKRHRDAWRDSIEYFEQYDEMRGELHGLFDAIRELGDDARIRMESIEKSIWGTWSEVEAAVARHGGGSD